MTKSEPRRLLRVLPLVLGSGLCALVYQTAWLRELRLIFGGSAPAAAAVLGIFLGGLGVGGLVLGDRAERHPRPLRFYGNLELLVALGAGLSPLLLAGARWGYIQLGGTTALGEVLGTFARLILAALVLGVPAVLMGGTLPAAIRAAEGETDARRRVSGILYGVNTLGAVLGTAVATFLLLEVLGTRLTLLAACCLNALVGLIARALDRSLPETPVVAPSSTGAYAQHPEAPPAWYVLVAAAAVGFAFLLMELVWFRMLSPLMGGSVYTVGIVLAVALVGIGIGGLLYALKEEGSPPTLGGFALTSGLEALALGIPFALGDRLAVLALLLRPLGAVGMLGSVVSWVVLSCVVVLPAAIVSGLQFPMLIALLGRGRAHVARDVGRAYAANTGGAIAGSLLGGFGLLPLLSAPGAWRLSVLLLALLGVVAALLALRDRTTRSTSVLSGAVSVVAALLVLAPGPTAGWRHSPIGAGRADALVVGASHNTLTQWLHEVRRSTLWEADGREAAVALLSRSDGYAFAINGKIDGNARGDAATQVMGSLLGTLLHPHPEKVMVIGMGTGSSAGWAADVPSVSRVDVVELERSILHISKACAPVNRGADDSPKVRVIINDAREVLLTTKERYDVIFSEPSNPYRVGISSLFTADFYRAVSLRLTEKGIFLQFLQAYEIDSHSLSSAIATFASVFPYVHIWHSGGADLILTGTMGEPTFDVPTLRARVESEPYRSALAYAWRVSDVEGVLAHHVARPSFARAVRDAFPVHNLNTDDRNGLEFSFAKQVGQSKLVSVHELRRAAEARKELSPRLTGGGVDWARVSEQRRDISLLDGEGPDVDGVKDAELLQRVEAKRHYAKGRLSQALQAWKKQGRAPSGWAERSMVAELLADAADGAAAAEARLLLPLLPVEAHAVEARLHARVGNLEAARDSLAKSLDLYRTEPWAYPWLMRRSLDLAAELVERAPDMAPAMLEVLGRPFAVGMLEDERRTLVLRLSVAHDMRGLCASALRPFEPHVPWDEAFLLVRRRCYRLTNDPLRVRSERDVREFRRFASPPFRVSDAADD